MYHIDISAICVVHIYDLTFVPCQANDHRSRLRYNIRVLCETTGYF